MISRIKWLFSKKTIPQLTPTEEETIVDEGALRFISDLPKSQRDYILTSELVDEKFEHYAFFNAGYVDNKNGKGFVLIPIPHQQKDYC
jgi:hypothetical protein